MVIFFILDALNMSYAEMNTNYGLYLVILNIILNIIMAGLNSILVVSGELIVKGAGSSHLGFLAMLFGMFTYGCTSCLVAFVANLGIVLSVVALPLAGFPYKLISLGLIILGFFITIHQINKGCKLKQ